MTKNIYSAWGAELELRFMKALRGKLEAMTDDEVAVRDTLEGATDADAVMNTLIRTRNEHLAIAKGRRELSRAYQEAAQVDEARVLKLEGLLLECLQTAGTDKWKGVAGTAYIHKGSMSTQIERPDLLPLEYMKAVPDVARVKSDLAKGVEVAGAKLVQGPDGLTIRLPRSAKEDT